MWDFVVMRMIPLRASGPKMSSDCGGLITSIGPISAGRILILVAFVTRFPSRRINIPLSVSLPAIARMSVIGSFAGDP